MNSWRRGAWPRRASVRFVVIALASLAVFGPNALGDDPDINTIRLEPGPTTAEQQAMIDAAMNQVGAVQAGSTSMGIVLVAGR